MFPRSDMITGATGPPQILLLIFTSCPALLVIYCLCSSVSESITVHRFIIDRFSHNSSAGIQDHRSCARKRIRYSHQGDVDTFRSRYCRDHKARYAVGFIFVPVVPGIYRCCYSLSRDDSYAVQTGCVYRKEDGSE